jgi:hypothetical protein
MYNFKANRQAMAAMPGCRGSRHGGLALQAVHQVYMGG